MAVEGPGVLPFVRGIDLSKNDLHVSFMNYFSNKLHHKEDSQLVLQGKLKAQSSFVLCMSSACYSELIFLAYG